MFFPLGEMPLLGILLILILTRPWIQHSLRKKKLFTLLLLTRIDPWVLRLIAFTLKETPLLIQESLFTNLNSSMSLASRLVHPLSNTLTHTHLNTSMSSFLSAFTLEKTLPPSHTLFFFLFFWLIYETWISLRSTLQSLSPLLSWTHLEISFTLVHAIHKKK